MDKTKDVVVVEKKGVPKIPKNRRTQPPAMKKPKDAISMEMVLMEAVQQHMDPDGMEKLLGLIERREADAARKEFGQAMARFQGEIGIIVGSKPGNKTRSGEVAFRYAPIEIIMDAIRKPLSRNGLSVTFDSILSDAKTRKTTCTITHELGHKETATFESVIDQGGGNLMNELQKQGSTVKYGERYSLCMALALVTEGEDDDGRASGKAETQNEKAQASNGLITKNNVKKITAMIDKSPSLETLVLDAYHVATIELIKKIDLEDCISKIEGWKIAMKEKKQN